MGTSEANPSSKIAEEARRFYNAGDENRWGRESIPRLKEQVDKCLRSSMVDRTGVVAELGCGRGAFRYLAELYSYVALDISFEALNRFMGPPHAIQADIENLPLASQSVDFVLSVATLEHVPHPEHVLGEIHRVLKPGGAVFLAPAWFCRPWAAKGLPVRRYRDLGLADKVRKALVPLRNNLLWRLALVMPRRLFREVQFRCSSGVWQFRYARLKPNLVEYIYTDCDAFSSLDPHEVVLLFTRLGYEALTAPGFLRRMALRHVPVVLRKRTASA
jgi:SAM-dependent methyltransferase